MHTHRPPIQYRSGPIWFKSGPVRFDPVQPSLTQSSLIQSDGVETYLAKVVLQLTQDYFQLVHLTGFLSMEWKNHSVNFLSCAAAIKDFKRRKIKHRIST
ncbi:hypothetical protein CRUP_031742 [Coryphaenoides rupestris]|nr:hypothetical protein CRUP_031742 [Coryphaenoides rupestris]